MKSEWKKCQLGDIITFQRGYDLPKTKMKNGKYAVIGSNGIIGYHNEYTTEAPSITIGRSGNVGNPFIVYDRTWSHNTTLYIKEYKGVDPVFVYYFLKTLQLSNFAGGSAVPTLNRNHIHTLDVVIPADITEQRKISSLLKNIDDIKRENTNSLSTLYDMLQATYKQYTKARQLTNVLSDICAYTKERIAVSDLTLDNYYSTENMLPNKLGAVRAAGLPSTAQTVGCDNGNVLVSNIRPYFKKILYCYNKGGCSNDVLCFTPKKQELSAYLFSTLYDDYFFDFVMAGSKGTKMPRGDKQQIMTYPIYLPTDEELKAFNELAVPILEQINAINIENAKLTELRDTLLPKLISGELDVSEVNI